EDPYEKDSDGDPENHENVRRIQGGKPGFAHRRYLGACAAVSKTLVQALPAFGKSRDALARTASDGSGLPAAKGQNSSGRSRPPRRRGRLGQPPRHESTKRQPRQNSGTRSSSRNAADSVIAPPSFSRSSRPRLRFGQ